MKKEERKAFNDQLFQIATNWDVKSKQCLVPGCDSKTKSRNLCSIHYRHMNREFGEILQYRKVEEYVGILPPYSKQPKYCIEECGSLAIQRGLCSLHYNRWRKANGKAGIRLPKNIDPEDLWDYIKQQGNLNK